MHLTNNISQIFIDDDDDDDGDSGGDGDDDDDDDELQICYETISLVRLHCPNAAPLMGLL